MGTKRASKRLKKIRDGVIKYFWVVFIVPILAILKWSIQWLWSEWLSKHLGTEAVKMVDDFFAAFRNWLPLAIHWSFTHPGEISAAFFFITLSIILMRVYWETRDPDRIRPYIDNSIKKPKGFVIENNSGHDLGDCTISTREADGKQINYRELQWHSFPPFSQELHSPVQIKYTQKAIVSIGAVIQPIRSIAPELSGKHEIELMFHGNKPSGEAITMPIYLTIIISFNQGEGSNIPRVSVEKVET